MKIYVISRLAYNNGETTIHDEVFLTLEAAQDQAGSLSGESLKWQGASGLWQAITDNFRYEIRKVILTTSSLEISFKSDL